MSNIIEIYVDFVENHLPGLKSGDYKVVTKQSFGAAGVSTQTYNSELDFSVYGERYNLKPTDIASVFPPANSLGEHSSVFPQIVFERNTLPWERTIAVPKQGGGEAEQKKIDKMPWMALLVFNEGELQPNPEKTGQTTAEIEQGAIMTLADFKKTGARPATESGDEEDEKLKVIYVKTDLLQSLLPTAGELTYLSHARAASLRLVRDNADIGTNLYVEVWDNKNKLVHASHQAFVKGEKATLLEVGKLMPGTYTIKYSIDKGAMASQNIKLGPNDEIGRKTAVVVANRLPKAGARSIVHLVSLEEQYAWNGKNYTFSYNGKEDNGVIPLVSLKSWNFSCISEGHNLDKILKGLITASAGDTHNMLRLPLSKANIADQTTLSRANQLLQNGYVPMPHFFRRGGKSLSWYRGPLVPGQKNQSSLSEKTPLPASCADELLMYDEEYGMFDASMAAAWELGRLLSLRNKKFSTGLYRWKRLHSQQVLLAEQQELHPHLPFHDVPNTNIEMPDALNQWLSDTSLLKGLPFNYLVPDEQMLPVESIRFFSLDFDWIACLLDGAFSIGRISPNDFKRDQALHALHLEGFKGQPISGFLLRSSAVAGWPGLQADGYSKMSATDEDKETPQMDEDKLPLLIKERLSPNVMICLFAGEVAAVDIHEKPEMLHLGFDIPKEPGKAIDYSKNLRNAQGIDVNKHQPIATQHLAPNWDANNRVVDVGGLFNSIEQKKDTLGFNNEFTSAQFALSLIEGVQKVRLVRKR